MDPSGSSSNSTSNSQPAAAAAAAADGRITLNVGGKLFETTISTLQSAGPDSLLAALSRRSHTIDSSSDPIFIDRDPDIFSVLLSLLRSGRLPSSALPRFSLPSLLDESLFYGLDSHLRASLSPPPLLGLDLSLVSTLVPSSDPVPSALSSSSSSALLVVAHAGQISSYDWSLSHLSATRTHLDHISSLDLIADDLAALGSLHSPGLHFYSLSSGLHHSSLHWSDPTDPRVFKARVTAIAAGSCASPLFAAFECPHRENCILSIDPSALQIVSELGRQTGSSIKSAAPTKLVQVNETGLIFASAVSSGAFGFSGYMKIWDPRSVNGVWETTEPGSGRSSRFGDSFANVDVDVEEMKIYKVCWKSGDVAVADMRMLGEDPWVYMEDMRSGGLRGGGGGGDSVVCCYKKQVFVSREMGLEVWSQVENDEEGGERGAGPMYRRNFVDREEDAKRGRITMMQGGGERLFVAREGMEGVEVWESSDLSGAISLL